MTRLLEVFGVLIAYGLTSVKCANCPQLTASEDVFLACSHPETGQTIPCNSAELPPQTVANYECGKYYTRPVGESESGRMTCQTNGNWGRHSQYDDFRCKLDCGRATPALLGASTVVVFGEVTTRENFPWHVAIFRSEGPGTEFRYFCGGSLVNPTNKGYLILTAAHCVTSKARTTRVRPLEDFRVVLGPVSSDYVTNQMSNGTQIFPVKAAKVHPNYNYDTIQNDVAIMKLAGKVRVSDFIAPICFPTSDMANKQVQGSGSIAGFGVDRSTHISSSLNFASLPVRENKLCNDALGKELTSIEFCAGHPTGKSICSGDSGGGLVFKDEQSNRFYVQGIASNVDRRPLQELKYCQNYNTFTRVSSYVDWVQDELDSFFADDDDDTNDDVRKRPTQQRPPPANDEFLVTVYEDYANNREKYVQWRMKNCSAVPQEWNKKRFWLDIHGKCLLFFEGSYCYGRSLQLQSTPSSSVFEWNFPSYNLKSVSLCSPSTPQQQQPPAQTTARPSTTTSWSQGVNVGDTGNDYEKVGLQKHNLYRTKHGVSPLTLNENLNLASTSYAYELLTKSKLEPSGKGGENLFEINGSSEPYSTIVARAVELWYKSMDGYNYNSPSATSFSQLVWKATKELGIGIARSGRRTVVVARYSPPGNIYFVGSGGDRAKYFRENVLPPRK
ncbi:uncharacterized protein LOC110846648 [Folsomia candida]|uniref:uncharacterized protein LOC110846648 n=1 Tax=Folsomia candida TaxID=158441 RepID=UPI000B8FD62D|nr:uncharacterized protein LOC110846648 [Folsomia candida]